MSGSCGYEAIESGLHSQVEVEVDDLRSVADRDNVKGTPSSSSTWTEGDGEYRSSLCRGVWFRGGADPTLRRRINNDQMQVTSP